MVNPGPQGQAGAQQVRLREIYTSHEAHPSVGKESDVVGAGGKASSGIGTLLLAASKLLQQLPLSTFHLIQ